MTKDNQDQRLRSLMVDEVKYRTTFNKKFETRRHYEPPDPRIIRAVIPGTVRAVYVKPKSKVKIGDQLLILEAMKMKNIFTSYLDGTIKAVHVKEGQPVAKQEILIEFE